MRHATPRHFHSFVRTAAIAAALVVAMPAAAVTLTELPPPDSGGSYFAANLDWAGMAVGNTGVTGILRWQPGAPAPEHLGDNALLVGNILPLVSRYGEVIVGSRHVGEGETVAARWVGGTDWEPLSGLVLRTSFPFAVSYDGTSIAGTGRDEAGTNLNKPWIWREETGQVVLPIPPDTVYGEIWGVSNDGSVAVGHYWPSVDDHTRLAARWVDGEPSFITDPDSGDILGSANACNEDCSIVVGSGRTDLDTGGSDQAWIWSEAGGLTRLGEVPDAQNAAGYHALDVSNDGRVVVGCYRATIDLGGGLATYGTIGFVWTAETGIRRISTLLESGGIAGYADGWNEQCVNAVTPDGHKLLLSGFTEESATAPPRYHNAIIDITPPPVDVFADGFEPDDAAPWPTPE